MKSSTKKVKIGTPLANPLNTLKRLPKKSKKWEYIAIKCHNIPADSDSKSHEINLSYYGRGSPEEWLIWRDKLLKALDGQSISTGPQRYTFTERLLTIDTKASFNQALLDISIYDVHNFNKVLAEMTKLAFPYAIH